MDDYLSEVKSRLREQSSCMTVHAVIGNEACDLDSSAAAITYAYFLHVKNERTDVVVVPVLNIVQEDFRLRTETAHFFHKLNIHTTNLLFKGQVQFEELCSAGRLLLTLVDHNVLPDIDIHLEECVVQVIDHHVLERTANERVSVKHDFVGSCCTLVAEELLDDPVFCLDDTVAELLYGTILVDTINRSPDAGKITTRDDRVLARLGAVIPHVIGDNLFEELQAAKFNISGLLNMEILRKDLKMVTGAVMTIAMSSVTMDMKELLERVELQSDLKEFCVQQNCQVVVIMTLVNVRGTPARQIAVYSQNRIFRDQIADTLDNSEYLELEPMLNAPFDEITIFQQGNVRASRKVVMPILKSFLHGGVTPDVASKEFFTGHSIASATPGFSHIGDVGESDMTDVENDSQVKFTLESLEAVSVKSSLDDGVSDMERNEGGNYQYFDHIDNLNANNTVHVQSHLDFNIAVSTNTTNNETSQKMPQNTQNPFVDFQFTPGLNSDKLSSAHSSNMFDLGLSDSELVDPFSSVDESANPDLSEINPKGQKLNKNSESDENASDENRNIFNDIGNPFLTQVPLNTFDNETDNSAQSLNPFVTDNVDSSNQVVNFQLTEFEERVSLTNPFTQSVPPFGNSSPVDDSLASLNLLDVSPYRMDHPPTKKSASLIVECDARSQADDLAELEESELFDKINTPEIGHSGETSPLVPEMNSPEINASTESPYQLVNASTGEPYELLSMYHSRSVSEFGAGSPGFIVPPNSLMDQGFESEMDRCLPSFNSAEMMERIHEKKAALGDVNLLEQAHSGETITAFTPHNSLHDDNTIFMHANSLPSLLDSEFLEKVQHKRDSLTATLHSTAAEMTPTLTATLHSTDHELLPDVNSPFVDVSHIANTRLDAIIPSTNPFGLEFDPLAAVLTDKDDKLFTEHDNRTSELEYITNVGDYGTVTDIVDIVSESNNEGVGYQPDNLDCSHGFLSSTDFGSQSTYGQSLNPFFTEDEDSLRNEHHIDDINSMDENVVETSDSQRAVYANNVVDQSTLEALNESANLQAAHAVSQKLAMEIITNAIETFPDMTNPAMAEQVAMEIIQKKNADWTNQGSGDSGIGSSGSPQQGSRKIDTCTRRVTTEYSLETEYLPSMDPLHGSLSITSNALSGRCIETDADKEVVEGESFRKISGDTVSKEPETLDNTVHMEGLPETIREMIITENIQSVSITRRDMTSSDEEERYDDIDIRETISNNNWPGAIEGPPFTGRGKSIKLCSEENSMYNQVNTLKSLPEKDINRSKEITDQPLLDFINSGSADLLSKNNDANIQSDFRSEFEGSDYVSQDQETVLVCEGKFIGLDDVESKQHVVRTETQSVRKGSDSDSSVSSESSSNPVTSESESEQITVRENTQAETKYAADADLIGELNVTIGKDNNEVCYLHDIFIKGKGDELLEKDEIDTSAELEIDLPVNRTPDDYSTRIKSISSYKGDKYEDKFNPGNIDHLLPLNEQMSESCSTVETLSPIETPNDEHASGFYEVNPEMKNAMHVLSHSAFETNLGENQTGFYEVNQDDPALTESTGPIYSMSSLDLLEHKHVSGFYEVNAAQLELAIDKDNTNYLTIDGDYSDTSVSPLETPETENMKVFYELNADSLEKAIEQVESLDLNASLMVESTYSDDSSVSPVETPELDHVTGFYEINASVSDVKIGTETVPLGPEDAPEINIELIASEESGNDSFDSETEPTFELSEHKPTEQENMMHENQGEMGETDVNVFDNQPLVEKIQMTEANNDYVENISGDKETRDTVSNVDGQFVRFNTTPEITVDMQSSSDSTDSQDSAEERFYEMNVEIQNVEGTMLQNIAIGSAFSPIDSPSEEIFNLEYEINPMVPDLSSDSSIEDDSEIRSKPFVRFSDVNEKEIDEKVEHMADALVETAMVEAIDSLQTQEVKDSLEINRIEEIAENVSLYDKIEDNGKYFKLADELVNEAIGSAIVVVQDMKLNEDEPYIVCEMASAMMEDSDSSDSESSSTTTEGSYRIVNSVDMSPVVSPDREGVTGTDSHHAIQDEILEPKDMVSIECSEKIDNTKAETNEDIRSIETSQSENVDNLQYVNDENGNITDNRMEPDTNVMGDEGHIPDSMGPDANVILPDDGQMSDRIGSAEEQKDKHKVFERQETIIPDIIISTEDTPPDSDENEPEPMKEHIDSKSEVEADILVDITRTEAETEFNDAEKVVEKIIDDTDKTSEWDKLQEKEIHQAEVIELSDANTTDGFIGKQQGFVAEVHGIIDDTTKKLLIQKEEEIQKVTVEEESVLENIAPVESDIHADLWQLQNESLPQNVCDNTTSNREQRHTNVLETSDNKFELTSGIKTEDKNIEASGSSDVILNRNDSRRSEETPYHSIKDLESEKEGKIGIKLRKGQMEYITRKEIYYTSAGRMSISIDSVLDPPNYAETYSGEDIVHEESHEPIDDDDDVTVEKYVEPEKPVTSHEKLKEMDDTQEWHEDPIPGFSARPGEPIPGLGTTQESSTDDSDTESDSEYTKPARPDSLLNGARRKKKIVANNFLSPDSTDALIEGIDDIPTPDDLETPSDMEGELEWEDDTPITPTSEKKFVEFREDEAEKYENTKFRKVEIAGKDYRVDMKVIEPYKKVLSHGGYYGDGLNAIILFCGCYLPDRARRDYQYVMDNLFLYVISTLELLVADDYMIVYFHGATPRRQMPSFGWLKRCYQMIDRRLRKNLKALLMVHPTLWLKTVIMMTKPFISSKFSSKLRFVKTLYELEKIVPMEYIYVPDPVSRYDSKLTQHRPCTSTPSTPSSPS